MKFSEQWLREWVNPPIDTHSLAEQLTMAGLEIESIIKVSGDFKKVVVGKIVKCDPHPKAEKLKICEVDIGEKTPLNIVCGGANARENLKVAVAVVGAELPNAIKIKATKLRDVLSSGMLCSAQELGLQESSEGILELPDDAPVGEDLFQWLKLNDHALDIHLTPNRGDCLSIAGIAREVGVLNNLSVTSPIIKTHENLSAEKFPIEILKPQHCPRYCGRVITDINPQANSPMWLREKLRRSGIRSIHPVVDVTNFVLLELGQPMHAFDLTKLKSKIEVRLAHDKEKILLLDGQEVTLDQKTLVIADIEKAHAIAGVMGGLESSVTEKTNTIFLESAFFNPVLLAGCARRYGLNTDSAYRFERGIDPDLARIAIERATALLLDITGGKPGPIVEVENTQYLLQYPQKK
jgi:phenylalanyl-tRNA synthetase beta chain